MAKKIIVYKRELSADDIDRLNLPSTKIQLFDAIPSNLDEIAESQPILDKSSGKLLVKMNGKLYKQIRVGNDVKFIDNDIATPESSDAGTTVIQGIDGADGREIELQVGATHIQWRYVGDASWTDLIAIATITGTDGLDGQDIDHVSFTSTTGTAQGQAGETDTYTVWGDASETINLGTFVVYNGADGSAGSYALNDLTDVNAPSPTNGQVLKFDSSTNKWIPGTIAIASILSTSIGDLSCTLINALSNLSVTVTVT